MDDNAVCIVRTTKRSVGTLAASWSYQKEDNSTILYCENGVVRINDDPVNQVVVQLTDGSVEKYQVGTVSTNERQVNSGVIDKFIESIQSHTKPIISREEGLKSLVVVLAMMKSAADKKIVSVK